jgi:hypothetical protein
MGKLNIYFLKVGIDSGEIVATIFNWGEKLGKFCICLQIFYEKWGI